MFFQQIMFHDSKTSQVFSHLSLDQVLKKTNTSSHLHPRPTPHYYCFQCPYVSTDKNLLKLHRLVHAERKAHPCPQCPYSSNRKDALKVHMNVHTGENLFPCPHCTYTSVRKDHLKTHLKSHTGEKPFLCPHCPYRSAQSGTLKNHMRRHSGSRPYQCPKCTYSASRKHCLKVHIRQHSGTVENNSVSQSDTVDDILIRHLNASSILKLQSNEVKTENLDSNQQVIILIYIFMHKLMLSLILKIYGLFYDQLSGIY